MTSLKEYATSFEGASRMKNISELEKVPIDLELKSKKFTGEEGEYEVQYITVEDQDYRVPKSVISQIKDAVEMVPEIKAIRVKRTGTTKEDTKYTIINIE